MSPTARTAAAIVALAGWIGLGVQLDASIAMAGSAGAAIVVMLRYFTVIGNLLSALLFSAVALGSRRAASPFLLGGITLAMLLIFIVYALLLAGLVALSGGASIADLLLHKVAPALGALWWLVFGPKAGLRWRDPLRWALLPLAYFAYALVRGGIEGVYAYPFLDVAALGWGRVLTTAVILASAFLVGGVLLVSIGRLLTRRAA
jgi:hypothetical protein